jgi:hypothetical protein
MKSTPVVAPTEALGRGRLIVVDAFLVDRTTFEWNALHYPSAALQILISGEMENGPKPLSVATGLFVAHKRERRS